MEKLYLFHNSTLVGEIDFNMIDNNYSFSYNEQWVMNGFELSPTLKFDSIKKNAIKHFVENLLPEGKGLDEVSQFFHISKANKFAILKALGLDTSGGLIFLPYKTYKVDTSFRKIEKSELEERIAKKETLPIIMWDDKPRLSIAGVQEKLPLLLIDDMIGIGEGELCSTHILKFNKKGENVTLNEYVSLKLSEAVGLKVAKVEYKNISNEHVLFVERFDRKIINSKKVERTHVIDGVQALGLPVSYKYERVYGSKDELKDYREGVSWKKLFNLSDEAVIPIVFKEQLIKWNIVNLCIGNSDAHGKNISFFVHKNGLEISPFYDIVNVTMYEGLYETDLAMGINEAFTYDISIYDFEEFLKENDIDKILYFNTFKDIVNSLALYLEDLSFLDEELLKTEKDFLDKYKKNIKTRVNSLVKTINNLRYPQQENDESDEEFFEIHEQEIRRTLNIKRNVSIDISSTLGKYKNKVSENSINFE